GVLYDTNHAADARGACAPQLRREHDAFLPGNGGRFSAVLSETARPHGSGRYPALSGPLAGRKKARGWDRHQSCCRASISLCEDAEASRDERGSAVPEAREAAAGRIEHGRGHSTDRLGPESVSSHDASDDVFGRAQTG